MTPAADVQYLQPFYFSRYFNVTAPNLSVFYWDFIGLTYITMYSSEVKGKIYRFCSVKSLEVFFKDH